MARLPDADKGQLPRKRLYPGRPHSPGSRALPGSRTTGRDGRHPGVALVLLQEPYGPARALSRARPLYPADEAEEHSKGHKGRGPHNPPRPRLLRVRPRRWLLRLRFHSGPDELVLFVVNPGIEIHGSHLPVPVTLPRRAIPSLHALGFPAVSVDEYHYGTS